MFNEATEVRAPAGGQPRHHPVRRHQAPGARDHRRGSAPRRHALRRPALARRHADQLQDRQDLDQAPEGHGADHGGRRPRAHDQEGSADVPARDGQARTSRSAASRTWPACPTPSSSIDVGYHKIAVTEAEQAGHSRSSAWSTRTIRRRHHLRDPGQRRLEPRGAPVRARAWPTPSSKARLPACRTSCWPRRAATSSSKSRKARRRTPDRGASRSPRRARRGARGASDAGAGADRPFSMAADTDSESESERWRKLPQAWSRNCAKRPTRR